MPARPTLTDQQIRFLAAAVWRDIFQRDSWGWYGVNGYELVGQAYELIPMECMPRWAQESGSRHGTFDKVRQIVANMLEVRRCPT